MLLKPPWAHCLILKILIAESSNVTELAVCDGRNEQLNMVHTRIEIFRLTLDPLNLDLNYRILGITDIFTIHAHDSPTRMIQLYCRLI